MNFESKYLKNLASYKLSSHRAWEFAKTNNVLKLDWNEASIPPSPLVFERIKEAIKNQKLNWYPDVDNSILLSKIANYCQSSISEVLYFASSDYLHEYLIKAFIEPEESVLIISPTYDNFRVTAESGGATISYFNYSLDFTLDFKALQLEIEKNTPKMVYLVNPNNPTGYSSPITELSNLIMHNPKTLFIIDEAYYEFDGKSLSHLVSEYNNLIISRTFSKAFALASFRVGYLISNALNINLLKKIRNAKNIPLLSQIAAEAALDSFEYTQKYILDVRLAREYFYKFLQKIPYIVPFESSANFIFIKFESIETKYELIRYLENKFIFVRDYKHVFGCDNYIRISIGNLKQMEYVADTINNYFENIYETNNTRS